jgi:hypothetical protein
VEKDNCFPSFITSTPFSYSFHNKKTWINRNKAEENISILPCCKKRKEG